MRDLAFGLTMTGLGMGVTIVTLVVLILVIRLLIRLYPAKKEEKDKKD